MSEPENNPVDDATAHPLPPLEIVFQDEFYVGVNKPSGLRVHRDAFSKREPAALQLVRDQIGQYIYPVHRLDRSTSGVLLFALTQDAASKLGECFRAHTVAKTYLAVVRGHTAEEDTIDHKMRSEKGGAAQSAVTDYKRLAVTEIPFAVGPYASARYSLVEARPRTGRWHQIRRHMHHLSHPIIGDTWHGDSAHNRFFRKQFDIHRLLLAATDLRFPHPYEGRDIVVQAPLAPEFYTVLQQLGLQRS